MNNETDYHDILKALREDPSLDIPTALDNFEVKDEDRRAEITEEIYEATRLLRREYDFQQKNRSHQARSICDG
jgi:hypothetical protein